MMRCGWDSSSLWSSTGEKLTCERSNAWHILQVGLQCVSVLQPSYNWTLLLLDFMLDAGSNQPVKISRHDPWHWRGSLVPTHIMSISWGDLPSLRLILKLSLDHGKWNAASIMISSNHTNIWVPPNWWHMKTLNESEYCLVFFLCCCKWDEWVGCCERLL